MKKTLHKRPTINILSKTNKGFKQVSPEQFLFSILTYNRLTRSYFAFLLSDNFFMTEERKLSASFDFSGLMDSISDLISSTSLSDDLRFFKTILLGVSDDVVLNRLYTNRIGKRKILR